MRPDSAHRRRPLRGQGAAAGRLTDCIAGIALHSTCYAGLHSCSFACSKEGDVLAGDVGTISQGIGSCYCRALLSQGASGPIGRQGCICLTVRGALLMIACCWVCRLTAPLRYWRPDASQPSEKLPRSFPSIRASQRHTKFARLLEFDGTQMLPGVHRGSCSVGPHTWRRWAAVKRLSPQPCDDGMLWANSIGQGRCAVASGRQRVVPWCLNATTAPQRSGRSRTKGSAALAYCRAQVARVPGNPAGALSRGSVCDVHDDTREGCWHYITVNAPLL